MRGQEVGPRLILLTGLLLESKDESFGHEFWMEGSTAANASLCVDRRPDKVMNFSNGPKGPYASFSRTEIRENCQCEGSVATAIQRQCEGTARKEGVR